MDILPKETLPIIKRRLEPWAKAVKVRKTRKVYVCIGCKAEINKGDPCLHLSVLGYHIQAKIRQARFHDKYCFAAFFGPEAFGKGYQINHWWYRRSERKALKKKGKDVSLIHSDVWHYLVHDGFRLLPVWEKKQTEQEVGNADRGA